MHSDRTNRSRIVVKATISEDLAGTEDHNVAKLQYLQKKNEKLNAMHIRSDIALPLRSRPRSHGLSQDIGHEGLSGTGLMQLRQLSMDRQQPGNQHAKRRQIPQHLPPVLKERLAQMTPEQLAAFLAAQEQRALARRQSTVTTGQSLSAQRSISQPIYGPMTDPTVRSTSHMLQDYQMQLNLLEPQNKRRIMMARLEQEQKPQDASSEQIKEMGRAPLKLSPMTHQGSNGN